LTRDAAPLKLATLNNSSRSLRTALLGPAQSKPSFKNRVGEPFRLPDCCGAVAESFWPRQRPSIVSSP